MVEPDGGNDDARLRAVSEEIVKARQTSARPKLPSSPPSDLDRLAAAEVPKVLRAGETVVAQGLGYFGRDNDAGVLVLMLTAWLGPIAGALGLLAGRHWWVALTSERLLVFRMFEAQATFPDSGMVLERSEERTAVSLDKAKLGVFGSYLYARLGGEPYRFRFPRTDAAGKVIVSTLRDGKRAQ
jgi:hypothetical protein